MALFNELLGVSRRRWNRAAARLFGMDEQEGVATLQPELQAVVQLEAEQLDYWHLKGGALGWHRVASTALAVNFSHAGIANPNGSGILVTVEGVFMEVGATGLQWRLNVANPTFTSAAGVNSRDTRRSVISGQIDFLTARAVTIQNPAVVGTLIATFTAAQQAALGYVPVGLVLAPNSSFTVNPDAVNTAVAATFIIRERPVAPGELVI